MKKIIKIALLVTLSILLCACGNNLSRILELKNKEYYADTTIEKLETFTSLTGIELNVSQKNETATIYNYIMDHNADSIGAIIKYENYIRDFGFERNEELEKLSYDGSKIYVMDGYLISLTEITKDNIIQYVITIPDTSLLDDELKNESSEQDNNELYSKLVDLASQGKYQEGFDFYNKSNLSENFEGYLDSKKYMFYCQAMMAYENGGLGAAYSMLKKECSNILDAPEIIMKLNEIIGGFNGIYKTTKDGLNLYIYIKDGKVSVDLRGTYEDIQLKEQTYIYSLIEVTYTTGEKTLAIGSVLWGEVDIDYVFIDGYTTDEFTLVAWNGNSNKTYNGIYKKISNSTEY